uniref:Uncharacterized protein n=1 Tax=Rhizophora mucronata TaxID=61149 RepID=A0A2P2NHZ1_RHIMU
MEMSRCLLLNKNMPRKFWAEATKRVLRYIKVSNMESCSVDYPNQS